MKIDIEGMELKALRGAVNTIRRCNPILYVEYFKGEREELRKFLLAHKYRIYEASEFDWLAIPFTHPDLAIAGAMEIR